MDDESSLIEGGSERRVDLRSRRSGQRFRLPADPLEALGGECQIGQDESKRAIERSIGCLAAPCAQDVARSEHAGEDVLAIGHEHPLWLMAQRVEEGVRRRHRTQRDQRRPVDAVALGEMGRQLGGLPGMLERELVERADDGRVL